MSFWLIQNADIFILSRFVGHEELGVYHLASRLGFVVSFLPQGFRMGMRPLRKSAAYDAFKEQYGKATAGGQLLAYFTPDLHPRGPRDGARRPGAGRHRAGLRTPARRG